MKVAVFIPAYEAESTIEHVFQCIPVDMYEMVTEILIQDDASRDGTFRVAQRLAREFEKVTAIRNECNLGYGGTQKKAYRYCLDRGHDVIVMLHSDGQYAPECLGAMISPLLAGTADIVLGSRILGHPIRGGMPLYKWLGNRTLTILINAVLRLHLTDYHTGYTSFTRKALQAVQFDTCGDGHEISTEILIRAKGEKLRVVEVPVPTYYGSGSRSITWQTSLKYGLRVLGMLIGELLIQQHPGRSSKSKELK